MKIDEVLTERVMIYLRNEEVEWTVGLPLERDICIGIETDTTICTYQGAIFREKSWQNKKNFWQNK